MKWIETLRQAMRRSKSVARSEDREWDVADAVAVVEDNPDPELLAIARALVQLRIDAREVTAALQGTGQLCHADRLRLAHLLEHGAPPAEVWLPGIAGQHRGVRRRDEWRAGNRRAGDRRER